MKPENVEIRMFEDYLAADTCHNCCIGCEVYKTVKEQNKLCGAKRARGRIINRKVREARKRGETEVLL